MPLRLQSTNPNHKTILVHLYLYGVAFVYSPFMHHTLRVSLYVYMQTYVNLLYIRAFSVCKNVSHAAFLSEHLICEPVW